MFRGDKVGSSWRLTRIDDVAAGRLPLRGLVSDIAVDWQDPTLSAVYLAFGGVGDIASPLSQPKDAGADAVRRRRPGSTYGPSSISRALYHLKS